MNPGAAYAWGPARLPDGRWRFRLWAPGARAVALRLDHADLPMTDLSDGWYEYVTDEAAPGDTYCFSVNGTHVPDPAARAQAGDVHAHSRLVDPDAYQWQVKDWRGRPWEEAVIYELHVGTFTEEGTFRAVIDRLDHLVSLGVTAIELMPVAQFAGNRGWGYDGVMIYAPHPAYGTPEDLKALVDAAHGKGLMILLDVVYNHFGPEGNHLHTYAEAFFDAGRHTPWGPGIAYHKRPVRDFFIDNALYWLEEFRFDGLRLDAIDNIIDRSSPNVLEELAETVHQRIPDREIHLTTEDNRNIVSLHRRGADGSVPLYAGEWNDDLHNAAHVIATGESGGYYMDFIDQPWQKLARALAEGFSYQGQISTFMDGMERGEKSCGQPQTAFISFLQNHDQVGNRALGERLTTLIDGAVLEVLTAMLLLCPQIPLLFMGEEWGETHPFLYFTDFHGKLADAVRQGRRKEFASFPEFADAHDRDSIPDPNAESTFAASRIDWNRPQTPEGRARLELYRRLLALRREHIVPHLRQAGGNSGRILKGEDGFLAVRWRLGDHVLFMALNLSSRAHDLPFAGGEIHAVGREGDRLLAPGICVTLGREAA